MRWVIGVASVVVLACSVFAAEAAKSALDWVDVVPKQEGGIVATPETLAQTKPQPGQTVWLKGGEYRVNALEAEGQPGKPIIYRAVPGERVNLRTDAQNLNVAGNYFWLWDLGVVDSKVSGLWLSKKSEGLRVINCMIAGNAGQGIGYWMAVEDSEIYGCLIAQNGGTKWPDCTLNHGIYTQNFSEAKDAPDVIDPRQCGQPWKRILDNIIFENAGCGIHAHCSKGRMGGWVVTGNIFSASGLIPGIDHAGASVLLGGYGPVEKLTVLDNALYQPKSGTPGLDLGKARNLYVGYRTVNGNKDLVCERNYAAGGLSGLKMMHFTEARILNNFFVNTGAPELEAGQEGLVDNQQIPDPKGLHVFTRVNQYDLSRVHLAIFNWDHAGKVEVGMEKTLKLGSRYRVVEAHDAARNEWSKPVAQGEYQGGAIVIPMKTGRSRWEPEFAAYILLREYAPAAELDLTRQARERSSKTTGREVVDAAK